MLVLPEINIIHLILPVTLEVGWRLDDPYPFPGPTHSTGGRGGLMGYDHDHGRGVGGDPEPGTYIIYI